ncbi:MAG: tripartite tricarboxylate transporter TctB family protein [Hyphomicrobiaceae bacterium]
MNDALARREIWLLLALLAASAIFYFFVIPNGIADPDGFGIGQGLPPSFTARVAVILIGVILGVRLIQLLVNPAAATIEPSDPGTAAVSTESGSGLRNIGGIACALAFAFALVPAIGYYLASTAMIAALMWVMGETRWLYIFGQPIAVIGLIWLLFDRIFSIKLPVGWLFGG